MWLALMRGSIGFALAVGASQAVFGQQNSPATASECKATIREKDFDVQPDGPFLQQIGYSKVLRSCVIVVVQVLPTARKGFEAYTEIGDPVQRKPIWQDRRHIRWANRALKEYPVFENQLRKLEINLVDR
jgi:hypothetical protein